MALTATFPGAPQLDAERLDCYRVSLEFVELLPRLLPRRGYGSLRDQLDRASASILLNIAEGCGRSSRQRLSKLIQRMQR